MTVAAVRLRGHPAHATGEAPFPARALPFIWHYLKRRPRLFAGLFLVLTAAAGCALMVQFAMSLLVDGMAAQDAGRSAIWLPLFLFVTLIAMESVFWRVGGLLTCRGVVATEVDVRLDLFDHLSGHPMRYFADHLAGSLGGRITATARTVGGLLTRFAWSVLPPCADFVGAFLLFLTVDWRMSAALVGFALCLVAVMAWIAQRGRHLHAAFAERSSRSSGEVVDSVANIWLIKAFAARRMERERLARNFSDEARTQTSSWLHVEKTRAIHEIGLWLIAAVMLAWCIHLWTLAEISAGEVVMVSAITFRVLNDSREVALALIGATQEFAVVNEALGAIARPHGVPDHPQARPFRAGAGAIAFEEVSFAYEPGRQVFDRLSLAIPAGQRVGLVGESGAGKSTLISLLQRLEDVQHGRVLVDGQNVAGVTQDSLRAAIAVVPQEVSLFNRSVLENIRYGRVTASEEEVIAAAQAASADAFIRALPAGYHTLIGERGIKLSGGQRQRLGIARALLRDAPILLLDEATSALDSKSEEQVQTALARLMHGRTVIAIAHRLSTLSALDRILVLKNGRIVEDGPPAELLKRGGVFCDLWRMQAGSFGMDLAA